MSAIHTVTVELDDDGDVLHRAFSCSGGPADKCHQWCAEGCEEECTEYGTHRWEPMAPNGESCRIVDWLDAGDVWDAYDDCGDGTEPNRSGRIEEEWDGDGYIWRYWDEPAQVPA